MIILHFHPQPQFKYELFHIPQFIDEYVYRETGLKFFLPLGQLIGV